MKARRIGKLDYSVYASKDYSAREAMALPWISYDETMGTLPQAQWMAKTAAKLGDGIAGIKIHDAETAQEAVLAEFGKTLLPDLIAKQEHNLRRLTIRSATTPPFRELWLLAHADQLELRRVAVVMEWIEGLARRTAR